LEEGKGKTLWETKGQITSDEDFLDGGGSGLQGWGRELKNQEEEGQNKGEKLNQNASH